MLFHETAQRLGDRGQSGILIFLPGWRDICDLYELLRYEAGIWALTLHSNISPEDQQRVFDSPPAGQRKAIARDATERGSRHWPSDVQTPMRPEAEHVRCVVRELLCKSRGAHGRDTAQSAQQHIRVRGPTKRHRRGARTAIKHCEFLGLE